MDLKAYLESLKNEKQQAFIAKLTPNVSKERFIGLKNPQMREIAKNLSIEDKNKLLNQTEFTYIEEIMIRRFVIERERDYSTMLAHLEAYLPYIDNWVTCDAFQNTCINKNKDDFIKHVKKWIKSGHTYTVRFGVNMLEKYYLDDDFKSEYIELVTKVNVKDEYYLKMMVAWYFATALAKQYDSAVKILEDHRLEPWTHNKAIQKAIESFRVTDEHKDYLRTLKIK